MDHPVRVTHYRFENFCIDLEEQKLLKNGRPATLSPKAFGVLVLLASRANEMVEKEALISHIWPDSFVEEGNLTQYIHQLRKVLGSRSDGSPFIETINKAGYRFTAETEAISGSSPEVRSVGVFPRLNELRSRPVLVIGFAFVIAAIFLVFDTHHDTSSPGEGINSIAVLPFGPLECSEKDDGLAAGITDAVTTKLSRSGQFAVKPASAVLPLARGDKDPVSAGRKLKVDAVMEGSAQRDKDRVRVTVRLIKVGDGKIVWAESFNGGGAHSFEMQESISTKVADSYITSRRGESLDSPRDNHHPQQDIVDHYLAPG